MILKNDTSNVIEFNSSFSEDIKKKINQEVFGNYLINEKKKLLL